MVWERAVGTAGSKVSPGFIKRADILSIALSLLVVMPPNPEASGAGAGKQAPCAASSATSLEVDQSLPPTPPLASEAIDRDSQHNDDTGKPYSVFTSRDKGLVVNFASFAALFRQVGTLSMF